MNNARTQFSLSQTLQTIGWLVAIALAAVPVAAEELVLKNGQRIVGTIVGFENEMFRVETEFGFALIRKDKVETVNFPKGDKSEAAKKSKKTVKEAENSSSPSISASSASSAAAPSGTSPAVRPILDALAPTAPETAPRGREAAPPAPHGTASTRGPVSTVRETPSPVHEAVTAARETAREAPLPAPKPVRVATPPPPPPPPASRPVDEPLPTSIQEHVDGTTYVNDSFHFAMFKPPGWKVFDEVPKETGSAIMAIGTGDEQTLLFVDRQVWSGTPDYTSNTVEARIRATYQEYHKLNESSVEVGGQPALRRAFKGVIDGAEWHGLSVHMAHGNAVFGIIGLTSAETYQFQQAIFNKIIRSFHFLPANSTAAPASSSAWKP